MDLIILAILFLLSWFFSGLIIHVSSKILGQKEGFVIAMSAALIGSLIYLVAYFFINESFISSLIATIGWLFALKRLYSVGWIRSFFIAIVIWILNSIMSRYVPLLF